MAHLAVRNIGEDVLDALKRRAAANGRSVEAEHRELLREALLDTGGDFVARAASLRQRLRSSVDSVDTIRSVRDGAL